MVMQPKKESIEFVIKFSKETGDFATLSITDLKVVALTHMLHTSLPDNTPIRASPKVRLCACSSCWRF